MTKVPAGAAAAAGDNRNGMATRAAKRPQLGNGGLQPHSHRIARREAEKDKDEREAQRRWWASAEECLTQVAKPRGGLGKTGERKKRGEGGKVEGKGWKGRGKVGRRGSGGARGTG